MIEAMALAVSSAAWAAIAAWATFILIFCGLFVALAQAKEARNLREEQIRPFVVVRFDVNFLIDLVVENIGTTIARNVRVAFVPPLATSIRDAEFVESTALTEGIATLVPGQQIRWFFDSSLAIFGEERNDLPLNYTVTVTYERPDGRKLPPDTYVLDFAPYRGSNVPGERLEKILSDNLKDLNKTIARWGDGLDGLRIVNRTQEVLASEAERRHRFEAMRRESEAAASDRQEES